MRIPPSILVGVDFTPERRTGVPDRVDERCDASTRNAVPSQHRADVALKTRVVAGVPHAEILRVASELDAGLVIVGATERRVNPTTSRIVRDSRVPVLVVPKDDVNNSEPVAALAAAA